MPDVIFARPTWEYESYSDLWKLVELAGYPLIHIGEWDLDNPNHCYIFSTPSTFWHDGKEGHGYPEARAKLIYWNIEWYLDVDYHGIPGVEIWHADKWFADLKGLRYVPMGSHRDLNPTPDETREKTYDVVTLWAPSGRRYTGLDKLEHAGLRLGLRAWGQDRHEMLLGSRMMVTVHQKEDCHGVAPLRWALAAAYRLPMLCETLSDGGIFGHTHHLGSDLEHIGEMAAMWLRPENARILCDYALALHDLLCVQKTFRKQVEANV